MKTKMYSFSTVWRPMLPTQAPMIMHISHQDSPMSTPSRPIMKPWGNFPASLR